jgi:hypothetical protein
MPFHYDDDKKKKKKRIIETDPEKKAWKALQSGGLDPVPFDDDFDAYEAKKHLKEELKGMGPEGKRFLKDKLSGKKYEGILKPKYKKDLLKELGGMSSKGKSYVKKELGDTLAEKSKSELSKELHGMGPEGKRFLHDKLESKEYKGKLKGKYKEDLDKELYGMSSKGKSYVKKELGDSRQSDEDYLGRKRGELEDKRKLKLDQLKKFKSNVTKPETKKKDKPEAWKGPDFLKPKDWDTMSEKEKDRVHDGKMGIVKGLGQLGQAFSDKDAKSYVKKEKGDVKMRGTPEHYKRWMRKERGEAYKDLVDKWKKSNPEGKDPHGEVQAWNKKARFLNKFIEGAKEGSIDDFKKSQTVKRQVGKDSKKLLERKKAFEKEKGDSKNWIQGAVKKPGALRDTAKRMGLIKGDELLSSKDLDELKSKAKKSNNALLMRRVNLAKTFKKMKK